MSYLWLPYFILSLICLCFCQLYKSIVCLFLELLMCKIWSRLLVLFFLPVVYVPSGFMFCFNFLDNVGFLWIPQL